MNEWDFNPLMPEFDSRIKIKSSFFCFQIQVTLEPKWFDAYLPLLATMNWNRCKGFEDDDAELRKKRHRMV